MHTIKNFIYTYGKRAVLCFLTAFIFYSGMKNYIDIGSSEVAVVELYGEFLSRQQAEEILRNSRKADEVTDICFVKNEGIEIVKNPGLSRQTTAKVQGILGMASLYDRSGMALEEKDGDGCIIDKSLALSLFGSERCVGNEIWLGNKKYQVRGVASCRQSLILLRSSETEQYYTQALIRPKKGQSPENAASVFLMTNGLSGILVDDSWLTMLASCFPVLFLFLLAVQAGKWIKKLPQEENKSRYRNILLKIGIWCGCAYLIYHLLAFPSDWLPDKWSNFSFWPEKIEKEAQLLKWYLMLPKTMAQTERFLGAVRCMGKCGAAALMLLFTRF